MTKFRIKDWTAKRSGPRMTIRGKDENGRDVKVSADQITGGYGRFSVANDFKTGEIYTLLSSETDD